MRYAISTVALLASALCVQALAQKAAPREASPPARKIPCKTEENAAMCYWTHGRLNFANGSPSYRIWKIGTKRILGVYSGSSRYPARTDRDSELPEFPSNVDEAYATEYRRRAKVGEKEQVPSPIYADFEICPLEPERPGEMQAVCIESAKNIFIEPF